MSDLWYAEIDEKFNRTVYPVTRGTQLHKANPLPLAWGYFDTEEQANKNRLPACRSERVRELMQTRDEHWENRFINAVETYHLRPGIDAHNPAAKLTLERGECVYCNVIDPLAALVATLPAEMQRRAEYRITWIAMTEFHCVFIRNSPSMYVFEAANELRRALEIELGSWPVASEAVDAIKDALGELHGLEERIKLDDEETEQEFARRIGAIRDDGAPS